jgi:hypothetical protein
MSVYGSFPMAMAVSPPCCRPSKRTPLFFYYRFVANVLTVILNKIIFQSLGFVYPLTLTVVHMATCTLGAVTVLRLVRPSMFVSLSWKDYLNGVVPLAYVTISLSHRYFLNIFLEVGFAQKKVVFFCRFFLGGRASMHRYPPTATLSLTTRTTSSHS